MSLQSKLSSLQTALVTVTSKTYHYRRPNNVQSGYIVWAEDGEDESFSANNKKGEQQIHGTIDYYTLSEWDSTVDSIQTALNGLTSVTGWRLNSVLYEEDTNLIHYEWEFWVA